jgi:hypothetical protein
MMALLLNAETRLGKPIILASPDIFNAGRSIGSDRVHDVLVAVICAAISFHLMPSGLWRIGPVIAVKLLQWRWRLVAITLPENIQNLLGDELAKALRTPVQNP